MKGFALFDRILVPIDGSDQSIKALEKALQIAKKFDGKITLIHAYSPQLIALPSEFVRAETTSKVAEVFRETGVNILADAQTRAEEHGVKVETMLKAGQAVETIIEASRKGSFDLIVMGARGLSPMKEMLLGSVSHGVTAHARIPILIVK